MQLAREKAAFMAKWQYTALKVVMEGLMAAIIALNPTMPYWSIDTNWPLWQYIRWTVFRSPIARLKVRNIIE
jgi:hypothetical protein